MSEIKQSRRFMHSPYFVDAMAGSDQEKQVPHPVHSHPIKGQRVELPFSESAVTNPSYPSLLDIRRSERAYSDASISQEQLSFLLWSAQGIQAFRGVDNHATFRPAPSGGARHPFELYFTVRAVDGLKPGLYRYMPLEYVGEKKVAIEFLGDFENHEERISNMMSEQKWAGKAAVVLIFTCVPYRAEWRYNKASHRVMLIDIGHVGQNVMLSAAALGLGSCCIAAYNQELCDKELGVDGIDEYTVYAVPVGVVK